MLPPDANADAPDANADAPDANADANADAPDAVDYDKLSILGRLLLRFTNKQKLDELNNLQGRFLCEKIIENYRKRNDVDKAEEFAKALASINDAIKELIEYYMALLENYLLSGEYEIVAGNIASQVHYLENNCAYFGDLYHGDLYYTYGLIVDHFHKRNENENADIYAKLRDQYEQNNE